MSRISFIPEIAKANFYVNRLEEELLKNLKPKIEGLIGVRFNIKGNRFSVQIAIDCKSKLIEKNPALNIGLGEVENPYTMSKELEKLLADYLNTDAPINTSILKANKNSYVSRMIIDLNPMLSLLNVIEEPKPGTHYEITRVINQKNNSVLEISMIKDRPKKNNNNRR